MQPSQPIPPGIKEDIEAYYANLDSPTISKYPQLKLDLLVLKNMPTSVEPMPYQTYGENTAATL
ncbi:MAG: hypothetical protein ABI197_04365 [Granulicella sp.]